MFKLTVSAQSINREVHVHIYVYVTRVKNSQLWTCRTKQTEIVSWSRELLFTVIIR